MRAHEINTQKLSKSFIPNTAIIHKKKTRIEFRVTLTFIIKQTVLVLSVYVNTVPKKGKLLHVRD